LSADVWIEEHAAYIVFATLYVWRFSDSFGGGRRAHRLASRRAKRD